ncbi:hypothetical protein ACVIU7_001172 [Bradyrhizobium liaoningense]
MAERLVTSNYDQLHHFIADGVWDATPLETELLNQADRLVGGRDAVLVIDDTSLPKKGERSVGVAAQYASALGKTSYAGFWVTRRSGGVVFRHLDDLDAVFESDTCADLRQLICAFQPPPGL